MRLIIADEATADIQRILDYVAIDSQGAARKLFGEFRRKMREIKERPYANAYVKGFEHRGFRRKIHGRYLIFYRVGDLEIEVLHVLHGAMDFNVILAKGQ